MIIVTSSFQNALRPHKNGCFYARDVNVVWTTLTSKMLKASGIKTRGI